MAGRPEEYFWRGHEPRWAARWGASGPADYVQAAIREGTTPNGVFGTKVMWPHMPTILAKLRVGYGDCWPSEHALLEHAFPALHFIWIWREDTVAQAVSFSRALQTNEWTVGDRRQPVSEPHFDFGQIHSLLSLVRDQNHAWRRWFATNGISPFPLRYEDLVQDMSGVTLDVLAFLGVTPPSGCAVEPHHGKQADTISAEWVARYRAMVE